MKTIYNFLRSGLGIVLLFSVNSAWSNNIQVSNVTLVNQNTSAGPNNAANHTFVRFDLSWENSWRTNTGPGNYDAAWVFVKFQPFGGNYQHATLSNVAANHTVTNNNGVPAEFKTVPDGVGVFVQRANNGGPGTNNWQNVLLRWDYPANGVQDNQSVTVQVFAVEMVFIPEGSFYLGDGNINQNPSGNAFRRNNQPNTTPQGREAYLVTSENSITFLNNTSTSLTDVYDPLCTTGYTLSANYPKGFRAFYTMKYEVSQKQYVDFFNTLPTAPIADPQKGARNITQTTVANAFRNNFLWSGNNLDDATLNRFGTAPPNQGSGDRAQNFVNWNDAAAYLDWSGLRPMSEFEYEKMCRGNDITYGPIYPINGEFAWGSVSINAIAAGALAGAAQADNTISENLINPTSNQANAHTSNVNLNSGAVAGNQNGPVRSGIFAAKNFTTEQRRQAGASFYGVMELTGNVREYVVLAGHQRGTCVSPQASFGSAFTHSIHGDGMIPSGNHNITSWNNNATNNSTTSSTLIATRGGSFTAGAWRASERPSLNMSGSSCNSTPITGGYLESTASNRTNDNGIRGVRSTFVP